MTTLLSNNSQDVSPDAGVNPNLGNVDPETAKKIAAMATPFAAGAMVSGFWVLIAAYMKLYEAQANLQASTAQLTSKLVDIQNDATTEMQKQTAAALGPIQTEMAKPSPDSTKMSGYVQEYTATAQKYQAGITKIQSGVQPAQNLASELPQQFGIQIQMMGDVVQSSGLISRLLG